MNKTFTLLRTDSEHPDFRKLVSELDKDLAVKNGDSDSFFAQFNKIDLIKHVVLVYESDIPVGCGALKEYEPQVMEIKRMFVPVAYRGNGIADKILNELEIWAKELGYQKCILETGDQMTEALGLYKKHRFKIIPNYGQYKNVATSICFEKELDF